MAVTGESYVGEFEGHRIALFRHKWNKTLTLLIDGQEVARTSCLFPGRFTLTADLEHSGVRYAVVAQSVPHRLLWSQETIAVDGTEVPLVCETPRGLFRAVLRDAMRGDPASCLLVSALALLILVALVSAGMLVWR
jgi:hypothetical protein